MMDALLEQTGAPSWGRLAAYIGLLWLAQRVVAAAHYFYRARTAPGRYLMITPFTILSDLVPKLGSVGTMTVWRAHADTFAEVGSSVFAYRGFLPSHRIQYLVADADGARALFIKVKDFCKPVEDYKVLSFFGENVVASEHETWRRHRRLTVGSFSEKNNSLVWDDTLATLEGFLASLQEDADAEGRTSIADSGAVALQMTLMIISAAGFGQRSPWPKNVGASAHATHAPRAPGERADFLTLLEEAFRGTLIKLVTPDALYKLPIKRLGQVKTTFDDLDATLRDMVTTRQREKQEGVDRGDLFSALLNGVQDEEGSGVLTTDELIGNMYIFLLAGHETTGGTLTFLYTLLALYPEHQQKLYEEAQAVFDGGAPAYSDFSKLVYTNAACMETLRLYPPVQFIPKVAMQDAMIPAHTMSAEPRAESVATNVFVPKGARAGILVSALHYNPLYWSDPFTFNPSRFIDTPTHKYNRDAFCPFSGGPRQCMGQKFAQVEMVAIVATLLSRYTIEVPEHLKEEYALREGETERDRRERVFQVKNGLTLTPTVLPLVFKRRE